MARRSQWRLWTLSATLIVLLRTGCTAVMTVGLQNGSARQLTPRELAELNGEAPAHSGRQSRPGHDRRRKSLLHGASRPSGSTPATRCGRAAASPPTGVPLQTFQRGWFEQYIKEGKNAIKWTRLSCRTFAAKETLKKSRKRAPRRTKPLIFHAPESATPNFSEFPQSGRPRKSFGGMQGSRTVLANHSPHPRGVSHGQMSYPQQI